MNVQNQQIKILLGKTVYAVKKDGSVITGKLIKLHGNILYIKKRKGRKVQTKAIFPLPLYDLLAIGIGPFGHGGYGSYSTYGAHGHYPYGPYGGYGYHGFF